MKYFIVGVIIIVLVGTAFWAGYKQGKQTTPSPSTTQTAQQSVAPVAVATPIATTTPSVLSPIDKGESVGDRVVGNRAGNFAPDFRLKNLQGNNVSLRDYLGREAIKLVFTKSVELQLQVSSQDITLQDPDDTVHHLYAVTSMPYTVNIDGQGIIR